MYKEIYLILSEYLCGKTQEVLDLSNYSVYNEEITDKGFKFTLQNKKYNYPVVNFHFEFDLENHKPIPEIIIQWWAVVLEFADDYDFCI